MSNTKNARLDIRLSKEQKSFFEYVAGLEGVGLTDFIITAVQKYAVNTVMEQEKINAILASKQDQEIFFEAMMNPPKPNDALIKAASNYKNLINDGDE
jgi:uncharacterized protein (DUF1778 family)